MPRYFDLVEANAILITIKPMIEEILRIRQTILDRQPDVWPVIQKAAGDGGNKTASKLALEFERLDALVHEVQDTGVILKDLNIGLLDFPALKDGREIYLCWKYGEDQIAYWHEVEAGYAGRQPL
jgi:hypothetical protein